MKLALNGATTMRADLDTDISAAAAAGFDCLEIWAAKLRKYLARGGSTARLKASLAEHGLEPYSINSIEHVTFRDEARHRELLAECEELCRVAAEVGCPYVVVVPSPLPAGKTREDVIDESVRVLAELADVGARHGVALAFEFLGQPRCSVQTLALADEIVRRVGLSAHTGWTPASVYVTEQMGNETLVFLRAGSSRLIARAPADFRAEPEQPAWLALERDRLHLFDAESGDALR